MIVWLSFFQTAMNFLVKYTFSQHYTRSAEHEILRKSLSIADPTQRKAWIDAEYSKLGQNFAQMLSTVPRLPGLEARRELRFEGSTESLPIRLFARKHASLSSGVKSSLMIQKPGFLVMLSGQQV